MKRMNSIRLLGPARWQLGERRRAASLDPRGQLARGALARRTVEMVGVVEALELERAGGEPIAIVEAL
jgi:hypothetical protein